MAKAKRRKDVQIELEEWLAKVDMLKQRLNAEGSEVHVKGPVAPPIGYKKQPSLAETVREMVKSEQLRRAAELEGYENFEEADDFDVDDDYDPTSPWENEFDPPIKELIQAGRESLEAKKVQNEKLRAAAEGGPRKSSEVEKDTPEA